MAGGRTPERFCVIYLRKLMSLQKRGRISFSERRNLWTLAQAGDLYLLDDRLDFLVERRQITRWQQVCLFTWAWLGQAKQPRATV